MGNLMYSSRMNPAHLYGYFLAFPFAPEDRRTFPNDSSNCEPSLELLRVSDLLQNSSLTLSTKLRRHSY